MARFRKLIALCLIAVMPLTAMGRISASDASQGEWSTAAALDLLGYIEAIGTQGLSPEQYRTAALRRAIERGGAGEIDHAATQSFALVAVDLARGHLAPSDRPRSHFASDVLAPDRVREMMEQALSHGTITATLDSLAPQDPRYERLRRALAGLASGAEGERLSIRASLERLRWLPRKAQPDRLEVIVPEFALHVYRGGSEVGTYRIIVGKPSTPTPQFMADVSGIIVNPAWQVPKSIVAESVGTLIRRHPSLARKRGYVWSRAGGMLRVTQLPGPMNALGQIKLDMPNPYRVYLHDTPDKALFERDSRAFSHGCIRVDRPLDLARQLLADGPAGASQLDALIEARDTQTLTLDRPMPVEVLYLTAMPSPEGTIRYFGDPYGQDARLAEMLDSR